MEINGQILPNFCKNARRAKRAFSLLELLVVVGVTSTLAALMLPALSAAKEKSRRTVCRNNMRQFSTSCYMFGLDNNDYFPSGINNQLQSMSMMLSDETYSNLISYCSIGVIDCPNIEISPTDRVTTNRRGVRIGYNYLAGVDQNTISKIKGVNLKPSPLRLSDSGTNMLMADANIWTDSGTSLRIAPHCASGPAVQSLSTSTGSPSIGSTIAGGNVAYLDLSVSWKPVSAMSIYQVAVDAGTQSSAPVACLAKW